MVEYMAPASPPGLYKSVVPNDSVKNSFENIWANGFGDPVLAYEKTDSVSFYHFYNHFDPSWNEIVWNDNFPAMIYSLLEREKSKKILSVANDKRIIDTKQFLPAFSPNIRQKEKKNLLTTVNLSGISWLLVFILFFLERLVSFQNNKLKTNE